MYTQYPLLPTGLLQPPGRVQLVTLLLLLGSLLLTARLSHAETSPASFSYTGAVQTFMVPAGVTTLTVVANGAQGGGRGTFTNKAKANSVTSALVSASVCLTDGCDFVGGVTFSGDLTEANGIFYGLAYNYGDPTFPQGFSIGWHIINLSNLTGLYYNPAPNGSVPLTGWQQVNSACSSLTIAAGACSVPCTSPTVSIAPSSQTITSGGSVTLTASGATTYTWSNGSTQNPLIVSNVTSATTLSVTGVTGGCSATASAGVSVTAAIGPCPRSITVTGTNSIFDGVYTPNTNFSPPIWQKNISASYSQIYWSSGRWAIDDGESPAPAAYNTTGSATNLPCTGWVATSGYGVPTLSGGCGSLVVGPSVSISPSSQTIASGGSVTLTASGATTYTWSNGSTQNPLILTNVASTTTLSVTGVTGACSGTASVSLSLPAPITATIGASTLTICLGQIGTPTGTTLTASGAGTGGSYLWSTGATTAAISTTLGQVFSVTATSSQGASSTASVTVIGRSLPTASITPSPGLTVCQGQSLTLTATNGLAGARVAAPPTALTLSYTWSTGATGAALPLTPTSSTVISLTISDGFCASLPISASLTVNPAVTASIGASGSLTICPGTATTLTASGGNSYAWGNGPATAAYAVSPLTTTTYSVTVTTSTGCKSVTTATVIVNQAVTASISGNQVLACGQSLTLTASGNGTSYTWSANAGGVSGAQVVVRPAQSGTVYSVTVTDPGTGCSGVASVTATLAPAIAAQASAPTVMGVLSATNCPVMIQAVGTGNSFVFTNPDTGFSYSTVYRRGGTYSLPAFPVKQPGTYTMTAYFTDACGTISADTKTFVVTGTGCN